MAERAGKRTGSSEQGVSIGEGEGEGEGGVCTRSGNIRGGFRGDHVTTADPYLRLRLGGVKSRTATAPLVHDGYTKGYI